VVRAQGLQTRAGGLTMIAKDPHAYSVLSLHQEKSLRDHGG
jgi:hypothetical protein